MEGKNELPQDMLTPPHKPYDIYVLAHTNTDTHINAIFFKFLRLTLQTNCGRIPGDTIQVLVFSSSPPSDSDVWFSLMTIALKCLRKSTSETGVRERRHVI